MRTVWSVHPANLLQVLLPLLPADLPLTAAARTTLFDVADPFVGSLYLGLPALALAAAAFAGPRPPWVLGFAAVAASLLALGRHSWLYTVAVQLAAAARDPRYPSKAMVPAAFAVAVLCAYGFEAWRTREAVRRRRWSGRGGAPVIVERGHLGRGVPRPASADVGPRACSSRARTASTWGARSLPRVRKLPLGAVVPAVARPGAGRGAARRRRGSARLRSPWRRSRSPACSGPTGT